jgi:hypothetical protein
LPAKLFVGHGWIKTRLCINFQDGGPTHNIFSEPVDRKAIWILATAAIAFINDATEII